MKRAERPILTMLARFATVATVAAIAAVSVSAGAESRQQTIGQMYFRTADRKDVKFSTSTAFSREYFATVLAALGEPPMTAPTSVHIKAFRLLRSNAIGEQVVACLDVTVTGCTLRRATLSKFTAIAIAGDTQEVLEFKTGDLNTEQLECTSLLAERVELSFQHMLAKIPRSSAIDSTPGVDGISWVLEVINLEVGHEVRVIWQPSESEIRELSHQMGVGG